jgi:cysteine desulfurase
VTVYLDHNATTPVDSEVLEEMLPFLKGTFGNPSSIHAFGQGARRGLDLARERVAGLIGAAPEEIVFTSGGTESNNHAIAGVFEANRSKGQHIITTAIEHQAVLSVCHGLEQKGARVTYVGVDRHGTVSPGEVMAAVAADTVLISVMLANNDVGTIQPVREIASAAHERGVLVHCDAVQAVGKVPIDVADIEADMISVSSHKLYGPKGAGALFIKRGTRLAPLVLGGHHESRRRAGTENVPAIVGFGKACDLAKERYVEDGKRIRANRERLEHHIREKIERVHIHGHPTKRLPGTLNVGFEGVEGETLLIALDLKGIAVSTGAACSSDSREPSHVLAAMGCHPYLASCSVRFSLGRGTTEQEIDDVGRILPDIVNNLRSA